MHTGAWAPCLKPTRGLVQPSGKQNPWHEQRAGTRAATPQPQAAGTPRRPEPQAQQPTGVHAKVLAHRRARTPSRPTSTDARRRSRARQPQSNPRCWHKRARRQNLNQTRRRQHEGEREEPRSDQWDPPKTSRTAHERAHAGRNRRRSPAPSNGKSQEQPMGEPKTSDRTPGAEAPQGDDGHLTTRAR